MSDPMNVIGWYFEPREDGRGDQIVLVQPGATARENIEHVARTPQELWAAFEAIENDPDLPEAETEAPEVNGEAYEDEEQLAASDDIPGLVADAAQGFITEAAGPLIGRLAGGVMRNPGRAMDFLRAISRKDRR